MRKFLLTLLTLVSVNVFAQIQRSVTYDFSNPLGLTPSVTPTSAGDGRVGIDEKSSFGSFEEEEIRADFSKNGYVIGVNIFTQNNGQIVLEINRGNKMTVSTVDEATINSISFSSDSYLGDLTPIKADENKGDWKYTSKVWTAYSGQSVSSMAFWNTGLPTEIKKMTVDYTLPIVKLVPVANIKDDDVLPLFKDMTLTFKKDMKVLDASKITVKGGKNFSKVMTATAEKNVVTLSLDEAIETDGTYTVTVPAGCLQDAEGFQNKEQVYVFKVEIPKNTFNFESVLPALGKVEAVPNGIVLTFPDYVGHIDSEKSFVLMYQKDENSSAAPRFPMYVESFLDNTVTLKFKNVTAIELTDNGEYTIEVPEKVVFNAFYGMEGERYNPAFTLTYNIGGEDPDEPDEPDVPEDSEIMKAAKELLKVSGVGYPAADSDARTELDALTKATEVPTDETLTAAMDKFYKESKVELPSAGKYYKLATKNNKEVADTLYLKYSNAKFELVDNKDDATAFEAETADGMFSFKTVDGKYVAVNGVTDDAVCRQIKIEKLSIDNVDAENLLGCVSLYGSEGEDVSGVEKHGYALMNYDLKRYGALENLSFTASMSSAFIIEEVVPEKLETVTLSAELTPSVVARNTDKLTLKFTNDAPVLMANTTAAYFNDKDGKKVGAATISAVDGKDNEFTVALTGLADGTYTLVIPEAMFTTEKNGKTANVAAVEKTFTIDISEADAFMTEFWTQIYNDKLGYCFDTDLNDFILVKGSPICVDETKTINIVYKYMDNVIRTGHMKLIELEDEPCACQLILDNPIKKGELTPGQYTVILEEATIGDENFGMYLADRTSVKKSDCNVNPRMTFSFDVDNNKATAITDFTADDNAEKVIYTISGRRVKSMTAPGIYIVNGKKVIKK